MIDGRLSVAYTFSPAVRGDVQGSCSARIQSQTQWQGRTATGIARVSLCAMRARAWRPIMGRWR
ncbi:MAG: hypothetical protein P8O69_10915 [Amylibacter sp.]|nr:hypothetical protein [Amylibacter sp.]